jgi:hypothetical protein
MRLLRALKYTVYISLISGNLRHPTTLWPERVPVSANFAVGYTHLLSNNVNTIDPGKRSGEF